MFGWSADVLCLIYGLYILYIQFSCFEIKQTSSLYPPGCLRLRRFGGVPACRLVLGSKWHRMTKFQLSSYRGQAVVLLLSSHAESLPDIRSPSTPTRSAVAPQALGFRAWECLHSLSWVWFLSIPNFPLQPALWNGHRPPRGSLHDSRGLAARGNWGSKGIDFN